MVRKRDVQREYVVIGLLEDIAAARSKRDVAMQILGWREIGTLLGFYRDRHNRGIVREIRRAGRRDLKIKTV